MTITKIQLFIESLKPRKQWVQTGGWVLVAVLLLFGISSRSHKPLLSVGSLAFSVLYLLTLITKKDAALTSRGLEIFYNMQFTTNYEFFPWEDINAIVCEDRGHADMVRLHIGHGNTEKALFFPRSQLGEIYAFAKKKNPSVRIMDYAAPEPKSGGKHKK